MFTDIFKKEKKTRMKKTDFNTSFSAISPYFRDKSEKNKLSEDVDFIKKYNKCSNTINYFMMEIEKYYSDEDIKHIVDKYIIGLNQEELTKMMTTYFSLSLEDKLSKKFFRYYDEKFELFEEDEQEELKRVDAEFNLLHGPTKIFNNISLKDLYSMLDLPSKKYVVLLLRNDKSYEAFKNLFESNYRIYFSSLIKLLINKSIDTSILNYELTDEISEEQFRILVLTLISNNNLEITRYVKVLIANSRYDLLSYMILAGLLNDNIFDIAFDKRAQTQISDKNIINNIEKVRRNRMYN